MICTRSERVGSGHRPYSRSRHHNLKLRIRRTLSGIRPHWKASIHIQERVCYGTTRQTEEKIYAAFVRSRAYSLQERQMVALVLGP